MSNYVSINMTVQYTERYIKSLMKGKILDSSCATLSAALQQHVMNTSSLGVAANIGKIPEELNQLWIEYKQWLQQGNDFKTATSTFVDKLNS